MRVRESAILAPDGRPILIASETQPYRNAGQGRPFSQLHSSGLSINAALRGSLDTLRNRSRDLRRNNPTVWKGLVTKVAEIVGTGFTPRCAWADKTKRAEIHTLWRRSAKQLDADGSTNFAGLLQVALAEMFVGGEALLRFRRRLPGDVDAHGRPLLVPFQVQVLPGDFLPTHKTEDVNQSVRIRAGIELNAIGRRVAYHLYREHPGDYDSRNTGELARVPATEILHLYELIEPGQLRGEPALARIIRRASMRDGYLDASLQRIAIASLFAGFVTAPEDSDVPQDVDADGQVTWEPGMLTRLRNGETITFPTMPDVGAGLDAFVRAVQLDEAAGMGIPYEYLTGDLSRVNFSSIRAGIVTFRRQAEQLIFNTIVPKLDALWAEWITAAVTSGAIELPGFETAAGRAEAFDVEWSPQAWDWVDPEADMNATAQAIDYGIISRRQVRRDLGYDNDAMEAEIAEERGAGFGVAPAATTAAPSSAPAERAAARRTQRRAALRAEVAHA